MTPIHRDRPVPDATIGDILREPGHRHVRVRGPQPDRLFALLRRHGFTVRRVGADELQVEDITAEEVRRFARFFHVPVHLLSLSEVERCALVRAGRALLPGCRRLLRQEAQP